MTIEPKMIQVFNWSPESGNISANITIQPLLWSEISLIVKAASFRTMEETEYLCGCDRMTIPLSILE